MSRMYTVSFSAVAVTVAQDLFEVVASSTRLLCVHGFELGQTSDTGDAAEEILSIAVKRGQTTSGNGGSYTPVPMEPGQGAAGFTAEINATTKATGGTIETVHPTTWNIRSSPFMWMYTPETRPWLTVSQRGTIELVGSPADSLTMSGTLWVEEIG